MFLLTSVKITPFVRQVNKTFCTWPLIHRTQQASVTAKLWEFVVTIFDLSVHVSQDEECLRPGDASDLTFLEKLEDTVGGHAHFVTLVWYSLFSSTAYTVWSHIKFSLSDFELLNVSSLFPGKSTLFVCVLPCSHKLADAKTRKVMGRDEFRLLHYAGEVNYNVNGVCVCVFIYIYVYVCGCVDVRVYCCEQCQHQSSASFF